MTHVPCDWCSSFDFSCTGLCNEVGAGALVKVVGGRTVPVGLDPQHPPVDFWSCMDAELNMQHAYDGVRHILKSWTGLFQPIYDGLKTHDLRVMDRNFNEGDICLLLEYEPTKKLYTQRWVQVLITYITSKRHNPCAFSPYALHEAMGTLSIKVIRKWTEDMRIYNCDG